MIQCIRVDFRLVHGQIIHSWLKSTNSNTIFILDDEIMSEPYKMKMFRICVPPFVKLEICSVEEGIKKLAELSDDKSCRCFVLLRDIIPSIKVCNVLQVPMLNIGETIYTEEKKRIANSVYVTKQEIDEMNEFILNDHIIDIRQVSDSRKLIFSKRKLFVNK